MREELDPKTRWHSPLAAVGVLADDGSVNLVLAGNRTQGSRIGLLVGSGTLNPANSNVMGHETLFAMPAYWVTAAGNKLGVDLGRTEVSKGKVETNLGIQIMVGQPDGGLPTLGLSLRDNLINAVDINPIVYRGEDKTENTPDDITIGVPGTAFVVTPYDAGAQKDASGRWKNDLFASTPKDNGPEYVIFEQNDVTASVGFLNQVHTVGNHGGTYGGAHYLANSYPEHLVFQGNTFNSGGSQPVKFYFNLTSDEVSEQAKFEAALNTHPSSFEFGNWEGENTETPKLPQHYQFHILTGNTFKAIDRKGNSINVEPVYDLGTSVNEGSPRNTAFSVPPHY